MSRSNSLRLLVGLPAILLGAALVRAEPITVRVQTKTSNLNHAGTDSPIYFAFYYTELVETPGRNGSRPRTVRKTQQVKATLDRPGNDRQVGGIDEYELTMDLPHESISGVEIGMQSGDDAWHLAAFRYQIVVGERESIVKNVPVNRWISGSVQDKAVQAITLKVPPPVFPRERK